MIILIYYLIIFTLSCIYVLFFPCFCSWHIIMRMRAPKEGSCDPIAPLELPHSLHAFHRVSQTDTLNMVSLHINYSSPLYSQALFFILFLNNQFYIFCMYTKKLNRYKLNTDILLESLSFNCSR